jgi:hypothetical protein
VQLNGKILRDYLIRKLTFIYHFLMSTITCEDQLAQFQQFRQDVYANFPLNRDSVMDLLDALSGNIMGQTPVELCEHPSFRRGYSALSHIPQI